MTIENPPLDILCVSISETCRLLGVSRSHFYKRLKDTEIASKKCGRRTLVLRSEIQAYVSKDGGKP